MKQVEIGKAIGFGWESIKKDFWFFVGLAFVYSVLSKFSFPIGLLLGALMTAGLVKIALAHYDGKNLPFETLFSETKYFANMLGAQILVGLIVAGGLILLIVPGIYWAIKYQFVTNIIVDKDLGILEAMGKSGEITKGIKLQLLLFDIACLGVMILGGLALGVGVFIAFPVVYLAGIWVYKKLL